MLATPKSTKKTPAANKSLLHSVHKSGKITKTPRASAAKTPKMSIKKKTWADMAKKTPAPSAVQVMKANRALRGLALAGAKAKKTKKTAAARKSVSFRRYFAL